MKNWIITHKSLFISLCCFVYLLSTGVPIAFSYGWITDIRPIILASDVIAGIIGTAFLMDAIT